MSSGIPDHLKKYIVEQDGTKYTPKDHATWRYAIRQLKYYLSENAHSCYLEGMEKTGIKEDEIPSIASISQHLANYGWTAVPVSGFIPPAAFMELQSLNILPIASDMRATEHILYTPAPDIVHEAAGHAPILIHKEFSSYLKAYAQVAKHAILSQKDLDQYEAIRELSDLKESPQTTDKEVQRAEEKLNKVSKTMGPPSEAAYLSRMNWWTAEYGLIGTLDDPKIFGAGLLSSIGESRSCLMKDVKKIPLTLECIKQTYDITEKQPQLFVTPDFETLTKVLEELSETMAYKLGGVKGLQIAKEAASVNTVEINTGLQVSGRVETFLTEDNSSQPLFFKTNGPTQISYKHSELSGHGVSYHEHGYSSPLGDFLVNGKSLELAQLSELLNQKLELTYTSGFIVCGTLKNITFSPKKSPLMLGFDNCTVTYKEEIFFMPEWGTFDLALGEQVVSVFGGPADRRNYPEEQGFVAKKVPEKSYSPKERSIHKAYQDIRDLRENLRGHQSKNLRENVSEASGGNFTKHVNKTQNTQETSFTDVLNFFTDSAPQEWLALLELYELSFLSNDLHVHQAKINTLLKNHKESHLAKLGTDLLRTH